MTNLIWLNEDALRATHPVFEAAGDDAHACFIWDDAYLKTMNYGYKKLFFIYETLCELPVTIYRGDTVETLLEVCKEKKSEELYIPFSPNPKLQSLSEELSSEMETHIIQDVPFVSFDKDIKLKRFFGYWKKARKQAMKLD